MGEMADDLEDRALLYDDDYYGPRERSRPRTMLYANEGDKCPLCRGTLVLRENKTTGDIFLGCSTFPKCRASRQLYPTPGLEPTMVPLSKIIGVKEELGRLLSRNDVDALITGVEHTITTLINIEREAKGKLPHGKVRSETVPW